MTNKLFVGIVAGILLMSSGAVDAQRAGIEFQEVFQYVRLLEYLESRELIIELAISEEQRLEIDELRRELPGLRFDYERVVEAKKKLFAVLLRVQIERLEQLEFRRRIGADGLDAGILHPKLKSSLGLVANQALDIESVVSEANDELARIGKDHNSEVFRLRKAALEEIKAVFTAEQLSLLNSLAGDLSHLSGGNEMADRIKGFRRAKQRNQ